MNIKNESSIFLLKKIWQFADHKKSIIVFITMFIIANTILLLGPIIFGAFIGEIQKNGVHFNNINYLFLLLFAMFAKEFVFWIIHGPARVLERNQAFAAMLNYRRYLLNGVLNLGLSWHSEHDSGNTIDKVNKASEGFFEFGQNIFQIIEIIVKLVGTSVVLLFFSPIIGFLVFVCAVISLIIIFQFDLRLIPQYQRLNEFDNKATASVFDALSNITTVKILNIELSVLIGVIKRYSASRILYHKNAILNEAKWFSGMMLFQAIAIMPLGYYIYSKISQGDYIDSGILSTLFLYLSELMFVFFRFGSFYEQITVYKNRVANAEGLEQAFIANNTIVKNDISNNWNSLSIKNLSFKYDNESKLDNLNKISFSINKGERIAIIGESGSGKTTFLKVLHGVYPKAFGLLTFDEKDTISTSFADIDLKSMLVPQEPEIFSSTIRENITLGIDYDDEEIMYAAKIAAFDKVILDLPKGLDSVINEKGVNLSGGQKQRLALSRALLFAKNKELILLDESTSSVDPENELEIYQNIWQAFDKKSIIASIHKMNLLKLFDKIVIFENSCIVDHGSFDELICKNSKFKETWDNFIAKD